MNKKFTTSKIILFIPFATAAILLLLMFMEINQNMDHNYLNYTEIALVSALALCGYITKWYLKKAALENEPKIRMSIMKELFFFQQQHPDFIIYDRIQMQQDAKNITKPLLQDEQRQYESLINSEIEANAIQQEKQKEKLKEKTVTDMTDIAVRDIGRVDPDLNINPKKMF
jgi:hypothetical protein